MEQLKGRPELANKQKPQSPIYYHGGAPGLGMNGLIRSPKVLGMVFKYNHAGVKHDASQVYMTPIFDLALAFAAKYRDAKDNPGSVYKVQPQGRAEHDPDFGPGVSFMASSARITAVIVGEAELTEREITKRLGPYQAYAVDDPVYDAEGYLCPAPYMPFDVFGFAEFLKLYGQWLPLEKIDNRGVPRKSAGREQADHMLELMPTLDSAHLIALTDSIFAWWHGKFLCRECGQKFRQKDEAVFHQIGAQEVSLIETVLSGLSGGVDNQAPENSAQWANAAKLRKPHRWSWYA